jgi:choline-sulfatase
MYKDLEVEPTTLDEALPDFMKTFAENTDAASIKPEAQKRAVRAYYALVTFVDSLLGDMIKALEETGQLEDTVIIYTADHGTMQGHRGLWYKNQLLESSIRIPFIFRNPQRFRSGVRLDEVVSNQDIFSTIAELGGAPEWEYAAGDSLVPLLTGKGDTEKFADREVFIEYADFGIGEPAACIRKRNLKLIAVRNYDHVLYDLSEGRDEQVNHYNDPEYSEAVKELEADLAKYWNENDAWDKVVKNQTQVDYIRKSRLAAAERNPDREFHFNT